MSEFAPLMASSFADVFAGFVVGLVVGLTDVGGDSLMIFGFGIKPHVAIGTDPLFAAFTKLGGTISLTRHRLIGSVDWQLLAKFLAGSLPGIWLGTVLMKRTSDRIIRSLLSILLAYAGLKLIAL